MKNHLLSLLFLLCSVCAIAQEAKYEPGQLFVKLTDQTSIDLRYMQGKKGNQLTSELRDIVDSYGITEISHAFKLPDEKLQRTYILLFSDTSLTEKLIESLTKLGIIDYAERVPKYELSYTPNDYNPTVQWHLKQIHAAQAWDINRNSSHVVIAIVDDAVRTTHRGLAASIWTNPREIPNNNIDDDNNGYIDDINGWDAADNDNNPNPPSTASASSFSHGTHCAGIAASTTDDGNGIASISFNARIMCVKTKMSSTSGPSLQNPYKGVEYAIAARANVISMSWGGGAYSQTYQNMFIYAHSLNITLVAAAGNSNTNFTFYPASHAFVLSVGATSNTVPDGNGGFKETKASFSNYGWWVDLMAPGTDIYSCWAVNDSSYGKYSGTSMACPLVAGLAALMIGRDSLKTPDEIEKCLRNTAVDVYADNPNYLSYLGSGRVDAAGALACSKLIITDFTSDYPFACPHGTVHYIDKSQHNPNSWQWSFPGGTPSISNQQNPTVVYNTPGVYSATLISANTRGTDTLTIVNYMTVDTPTAAISGSATVYAGFPTYVEINFTGNPPFTCQIFNGITTATLTNITMNPYFYTVVPNSNTTYRLTSMSDANCAGTVSGTFTLTMNTTAPACNAILNIRNLEYNTFPIMWTQGHYLVDGRVQNIGDLNGDGFTDVVVTQPRDSVFSYLQGSLWVIFLDRLGSVLGQQRITTGQGGFSGGLNYSDTFGSDVTSMGDLDGDGIIDLAVGSGGREAVFIFYMNRNGTIKSQVSIDRNTSSLLTRVIDTTWGFGSQLANMGDMDGDGVPELAVGDRATFYLYITPPPGGKVHILFMNRNGTVKRVTSIEYGKNGLQDGNSPGDNWGESVANIGDLDGNGVNDLAVGENFADSTVSTTNFNFFSGKAFILFLNADGTLNHFKVIRSPSVFPPGGSGDDFGRGIEAIADIDGDGRTNIIVGAPYTKVGNNYNVGKIWFFNLNPDGSVFDTSSISYTAPPFGGSTLGPFFGSSIANLGDMNGDGGLDLAVIGHAFLRPGTPSNNVHNAGGIFFLNLSPCPYAGCRIAAAYSATKACAGTPVIFTDQSTDDTLSRHIISWNWKFGDGTTASGIQNPTHTYTLAGTYQAQLVVGNDATPPCFDTIIKSVTVSLGYAAFTVDTIRICRGDTALLGLTDITCGKAPYRYSWSPTSSLLNATTATPTFIGLTSGLYTVTVTDSLNRTTTARVYVKVNANCCPTKALLGSIDPIYCAGESITLQNLSTASSLATYAWQVGTQSFTGRILAPIVFNAPGTYAVSLTVTDTCATLSTTAYINVAPPPAHENRIDSSLCNVPNFIVPWTGITDYIYSWNPTTGVSDPAAAGPSITASVPTMYVRTITDYVTGCSATDTLNITGTGLLNVNIGLDTVLCYGGSITLDATTPNASYLWIDSSTNATYTPTDTGATWVRVTSAGCAIGYDTINISMQPNIAFNLGNDTTICNTDSLVLSAPAGSYAYLYWQGVLDTTGTYVVRTAGEYSLVGYDKRACTATDTIKVTMEVCSGIAELAHTPGITVYPNPSDGLYHITITAIQPGDKLELEVLDLLGRSLYHVATQADQPTLTRRHRPTHLPCSHVLAKGKSQQHTVCKEFNIGEVNVVV